MYQHNLWFTTSTVLIAPYNSLYDRRQYIKKYSIKRTKIKTSLLKSVPIGNPNQKHPQNIQLKY